MAQYADIRLTSAASQMKEALSGMGPLPTKGILSPSPMEGFDVCPIDVSSQKRSSSTPCTLPENLSDIQLQQAVTTILNQLVSQKMTVLQEVAKLRAQAILLPSIAVDLPIHTPNLGDPTNADIHKNVVSAMEANQYLKIQEAAAKAGTLMPLPNDAIASSSPAPAS
jgi:hypothetical protein